MPWFPVDDAFHGHPKARKAGFEAIGLWTICGSYCMAYLTDGFVSESWVREKPRGTTLAKRLVAAGLWTRGENDGEPGFWFHDWKDDCRKTNILADRRASAARQEVARNPQLRSAIRDRDGDSCRYCGTPVEWHNRRGPTGGTYDHVIPNGGTTINNLVVCCRGCNSRKGRRAPEQAGMKLRPLEPNPGPGNGSGSDLSQMSNGSRSVSSPLHSTPLHSNNPLADSGGGVTQVAARGARPECHQHEENSDTACRKCMRRREWDEAHAAQAESDDLERRRAAKAAATQTLAACQLCDEYGWTLGPDRTPMEPPRKCPHPEARHA